MSSTHPTNSTSEEELDGNFVGEGVLSLSMQRTCQNAEGSRRRSRAVHRTELRGATGSALAPRQEKRELEEALQKMTMSDDLARDSQSGGIRDRDETSEAATEGDSKQRICEQLGCLRAKLSQREGEVKVLKRTFEESWCRERRLFERICQLESFITANRSGHQDQIGTTEGFERSREVFWEQETINASSQTAVTDPVIIEKLNLAYEDLTAIYDLRVDIDHQLNELHHGVIDPALRKQIIKIVREKELELRSQRFTK